MSKKYILHPGYVQGSSIIIKHGHNRREEHYINAGRLVELYNVPLSECIIYDNLRPETINGFRDSPEYIHLYPEQDSNYTKGGDKN